jgi:hypothetical protein
LKFTGAGPFLAQTRSGLSVLRSTALCHFYQFFILIHLHGNGLRLDSTASRPWSRQPVTSTPNSGGDWTIENYPCTEPGPRGRFCGSISRCSPEHVRQRSPRARSGRWRTVRRSSFGQQP